VRRTAFLRHLLNSYQKYYNEARTHLSLHTDAPIPRAVQTVGRGDASSGRTALPIFQSVSFRQGHRPQINADLRALFRRMSIDNLLWGAPRIHGELLKLRTKCTGAVTAIRSLAPGEARSHWEPHPWPRAPGRRTPRRSSGPAS